MLLLQMEFERIGACHRPYTQKRSCLPPLIRLPFGQPPSPRGRHPSDESVHFYVVQPYPLRATQAWPTSPLHAGRQRLTESLPGIRAGGACHRPYTQKRSCLPPLIRLPFGQPPSPRGRHPSDESVHFYVVQPYPLRATQAWPTSPYTPGGLRFAASAYGIRAHRGMPPPLQNLPGMLAESAFPHSLYIDQRLLRKISGKGKNSG